ncbi:MAG: DUF962 domain-containing protein [Oligoflexia bacterium]|nr:DUF962 domain-containing protein [Oligoflexia bacterium]
MPGRLSRYFSEYAAFHQTSGNRICHGIGIPMIMIGLLGLLARLTITDGFGGSALFRLDAGVVLWAVCLCWYVFLDWRMTIPFSMVSLGMYFLGRAIPSGWLWGLFLLGWGAQLIGHAFFEKKAPAFVKNLGHLLIGPFWIFARIFGFSASRLP